MQCTHALASTSVEANEIALASTFVEANAMCAVKRRYSLSIIIKHIKFEVAIDTNSVSISATIDH